MRYIIFCIPLVAALLSACVAPRPIPASSPAAAAAPPVIIPTVWITPDGYRWRGLHSDSLSAAQLEPFLRAESRGRTSSFDLQLFVIRGTDAEAVRRVTEMACHAGARWIFLTEGLPPDIQEVNSWYHRYEKISFPSGCSDSPERSRPEPPPSERYSRHASPSPRARWWSPGE